MKNKVRLLLSEVQQKMSGYAVFLNYRYLNFCVKAEPISLLSVNIVINDEERNIEDVASVDLPNTNHILLYPYENSFVFPICKGINQVHPEFKIERKRGNDAGLQTEGGSNEGEEDERQVIVCTMPEMNKDRHDAGLDFVDAAFHEAKGKIEFTHKSYSVKIADALKGEKAEEIDEATNELDDIHKQIMEMCEGYRNNKAKEIEEAYQYYLQEQEKKMKTEQETHTAHNQEAGHSMQIPKSSIFS